MADRREAILNQILVLLRATGEFVTVDRNTLKITDEMCPAVVLFDGDEVNANDRPDADSWSPPGRPQFMTMRPDICLRIMNKSVDVGTELNRLRAAIYHAIVMDKTLHDLVGTNGRMIMDASRTQLAAGRKMTGDTTISFAFTYPLLVRDLVITGSAAPVIGPVDLS